MSIKTDPRGSLTQLAEIVGLSKSYFFILRHKTRERFDYMFSFDFNYKKSFFMYIERVEGLTFEISDILNKVQRHCRYGEMCKQLGFSKVHNKNRTQVFDRESNTVNQLRLEDKDFLNIRFITLKRWIKIVDYVKDENVQKELYSNKGLPRKIKKVESNLERCVA